MNCLASLLIAGQVFLAAEAPAPADTPEELKQTEEARTDRYAAELEAYLQDWLVDQYPERAAKAWHRDYSSIDAFMRSVEPNRERWRKVLNPPDLTVSGAAERLPYNPQKSLPGEWISIPMGGLKAEAFLVMPENVEGPVPLVIAQHGLGSFPERVFGMLDTGGAYHSYGRVLVEQGFAVLAPFNLRTKERRNRIERLCRLADTTLPGIELLRMQALLDVVLEDPRIDRERVGMWGVSLGGLATMFWMPLEPRIQAGVVCAWFNQRPVKMAIPDDRYVSFLVTQEEHAFFRGWLTEFTDEDVASLICPRPLQVQTGKKDRIAHWPQVVEAFEASRVHYEKLGIEDRIEMDLKDGVHEAHVEGGVRFLKKWLMETPITE